MTAGIIFSVVGLAILAYVSDKFVAAAGSIAAHYRISPVIIGAVIVGFGTSAPEMAVSGIAAANGDSDLGIGNVIGSNVANVTLVLGAAALVAPVPIRRALLRRELIISVGAVGLFALLVQGGLHLLDGIILLGVLVGLIAGLFGTEWDRLFRRGPHEIASGGSAGSEESSSGSSSSDGSHNSASSDSTSAGTDPPASDPPAPKPLDTPRTHLPRRDILWLIIGLGGTIASAQLIVEGAQLIAQALDLGSGFVGLTLVAAGTSLPELVTAAAASRRRMNELIIGNILGSNIFNSLAVGGLVGVIGATDLQDATLAGAATVVMLICMLAMALFVATRGKVSRIEGAILLAAWFAALPFTLP